MITVAVLAAWLFTDLVATYSVIHYRRGLGPLPPARDAPKTVILVAIKGVSGTTPSFLERLARQHYAAYRLVFALESADDPVLPLIESLKRDIAGRIELGVVIAGSATMRAQKVHSLLAALSTLREEDRVVVFADADILPGEDWLTQLIRPIANREVAASTGYRWLLPTDSRWASLTAAAADLSIATAARSWRWNLCWGGSTAVERSALDRIDLPAVWDRAASDDLTLTAALRTRGLKINAPVHVLVPSPVAYRWSGLFSFARRQYLMVHTYALRHWLLAGWALGLPAVAAVTAVKAILDARWWALAVLVVSVALLQIRLQARRGIADVLLPHAEIAAARRAIRFARWAWPLIHLLHLGVFLASAGARRFTWAGIDYRLDSAAVVVEGRAANALQMEKK